MINEKARDLLARIEVISPNELRVNSWWGSFVKDYKDALQTAIKSLEAWELVKKELIAKKNFNAEVKDAFEVGSHSRIECNTTVAVLGEVLNLIDKHLAEVRE